MVKLIQILFAVLLVNHLGLTFVLGRSFLAENSGKSVSLRDQNTHLIKNNLGRMPRDVVATKPNQGSQFLRHLQRLKRSDHPCVKSKGVMIVGRRRYAVASCHASINTGCLATMLKYSTPLCVELKKNIFSRNRERYHV